MDMYQKRKMRQEKKKNEDNNENQNKINLSWVRRIYGKLPKSIEDTDILTLNILHILIKL